MERDYNKEFHKLIDEVSSLSRRPTLFLHACCGPCLTYPYTLLEEYFDITVGYINPNIYPVEEYERRLVALEKFLSLHSMETKKSYSLVLIQDDFKKYQSEFLRRKDEREGGDSCLLCHQYRMNLAYNYASAHNFEYFTTVMTVSSKKPSRELNEIGEELSRTYTNTRYLFSDFKKENGQLKGVQLSKKYGLYRQDYCGCRYSLSERLQYKKEKELIA